MAAKRLWTETYRPSTLEGYVFQNAQHEQQLKKFIAEGDIPHLLLTGGAGSGKTTISKILINELGVEDTDILKFNASKETGVDFIRDVLLPFAESYPIGQYKVIQLEEFDYMSQNAQGMLRDVMESNASTCRFIATCNFEHKIIPPLKSRFQHLRFKAPARDDVLLRMCEILIAENVEFDPEVLDKYVSQAYPDLRKIINNLQLNTTATSGFSPKLGEPTADADGEDYQFKLLDLLESGDLPGLAKLVYEQCEPAQVTDVYEFLVRNLHKHPKLKVNKGAYEQCLVILNEAIYRHGLVALPAFNFRVSIGIKMEQAIA